MRRPRVNSGVSGSFLRVGFWSRILALSLAVAPLAWTVAALADNCAQDVHNVIAAFSQSRGFSQALDKTQMEIGRRLTQKEEGALEGILREGKRDAYTASEVAKQNRDLAKAGFKAHEVEAMRRAGILGNSTISFANGAPTGIGFHAGRFEELSGTTFSRLQKDEKLHYAIGEDGKIWVTKEPISFPNDKVMIVNTAVRTPGVEDAMVHFVVREAGELGLNQANKSVVFKPQYGLHAGEAETREILSNVSAISPGIRTTYQASPAIPHSRVIQCLDILSAQSNGKNFVLDRVIAENAVLVGAVGIGELAGAGRTRTTQGQLVLAGDVAGTTVNTVAGAYIAKNLVMRDAGLAQSLLVRTGMGLGMIEAQKYVHRGFVGEEQKQVAEDIANFNRAHFFARLPINHYFDNFIVKTLPKMVFDSCQRNSKLSVAISPRAVRLYERNASAVMYFGLRSAIVGN